MFEIYIHLLSCLKNVLIHIYDNMNQNRDIYLIANIEIVVECSPG